MRTRIFALALVCAASLCGQRRFSWQGYCFDHPAAPFCSGHEYAIKPTPKGTAPPTVTSSLIVVGGIEWRFADPLADALVGFNFSGLSASPLARSLVAQLGASQGVTEADVRKIFDGLSGVDQVVLSVRDSRIVAMVTGAISTLPAPEAGLKAVPVSGSAMLIGHADAVDEAVQRLTMNDAPPELARLAQKRQAGSEFWAVGSAGLVGPQAVSAGVKRFSLAVSIRNRLASDMAFEFDGAPPANSLETWQAALGGAVTLEGNVVHVRTSIEADEVAQRFGQIAASPGGQRLADLVKAARYLPARDTIVPSKTKPVIYGLDGGPKEVNSYPSR
jgi:hypothetical protein